MYIVLRAGQDLPPDVVERFRRERIVHMPDDRHLIFGVDQQAAAFPVAEFVYRPGYGVLDVYEVRLRAASTDLPSTAQLHPTSEQVRRWWDKLSQRARALLMDNPGAAVPGEVAAEVANAEPLCVVLGGWEGGSMDVRIRHRAVSYVEAQAEQRDAEQDQ